MVPYLIHCTLDCLDDMSSCGWEGWAGYSGWNGKVVTVMPNGPQATKFTYKTEI